MRKKLTIQANRYNAYDDMVWWDTDIPIATIDADKMIWLAFDTTDLPANTSLKYARLKFVADVPQSANIQSDAVPSERTDNPSDDNPSSNGRLGYDTGGTLRLSVHKLLAADLAEPLTPTDYNTVGYIDVDYGAWVDGVTYSTDVTALVSSFLSAPGYTPGDKLAISAIATDVGTNKAVRLANYDDDSAPHMDIKTTTSVDYVRIDMTALHDADRRDNRIAPAWRVDDVDLKVASGGRTASTWLAFSLPITADTLVTSARLYLTPKATIALPSFYTSGYRWTANPDLTTDPVPDVTLPEYLNADATIAAQTWTADTQVSITVTNIVNAALAHESYSVNDKLYFEFTAALDATLTLYSYEGDPAKAAYLRINYQSGAVTVVPVCNRINVGISI